MLLPLGQGRWYNYCESSLSSAEAPRGESQNSGKSYVKAPLPDLPQPCHHLPAPGHFFYCFQEYCEKW